MLRDADLPDEFLPLVKTLMADQPRRQRMRQAMGSMARPDAARAISQIMVDMEASSG
jgi:UDP-N-acetylglucosamine:LPS N-acetylglucosamine transferase